MTDEELIEHWRAKASEEWEKAQGHLDKSRGYGNKTSEGYREQVFLWGLGVGRSLACHQSANDLKERNDK